MTAADLLLLAAVGLPALLALAAVWRRMRPLVVRLAPWAPLPALASALLPGPAPAVELPDLLLGVALRLDATGAVFLGFTALLWLLAGVFARSYMAGSRRNGRFTALWLATLTGNFGLIAAADVVGFYFAFSLMTLASYGLVVHDETPEARRAGRVYITLAVVGETALLLGFMLATMAATDIRIVAVAAGVIASPWPNLTVALLIVGFGVKAGLVPLHVWLPLAHPAAPTPASAVLSGAIIKAGILGLLRFLPLEAELAAWGGVLTTVGLLTAWYGILVGLPQRNPKTVLAYSSLSQMGLVTAGLGAALTAPGGAALAAAPVMLYAASHGLAKGALFLGVGVADRTGRARAWPVFVLLMLAGLSVAGLPLTGGALAKLLLKDLLGKGTAETLAALSAVGTTLLMARFLWTLQGHRADRPDATAPAGILLPWIACLILALAVPWAIWLGVIGTEAGRPFAASVIWSGLWAPLVGIVLAVAAAKLRLPLPAIPEGDVVRPAERSLAALRRLIEHWPAMPEPAFAESTLAGLERAVGRFDTALRQWPVAACALLFTVLILALGFAMI